MTQQKPVAPTEAATTKAVVSPQLIAMVCLVISFVAGILASRGLITKETLAYLGTAEFQAVVGSILLAGAGLWGLIKNRPHGIIQSAADLPQVDAVVTKPKTASEIPLSNVVPSVAEAAKLPGITQG
ncbi:hypothetical protein ABC766_00465 [Methylobacterium fujisawaense]|jgi:hypothetical protein|uniref:Pam3-gp28 family putative phage holin n=1 Tax=Methylobacterium fujisawaense TaxID=107400 RepID=UPI0031F5D4FD